MLSRRSFFKYMGIAGAAALSSAALAGCSQQRSAGRLLPVARRFGRRSIGLGDLRFGQSRRQRNTR